MEKRAVLPSPPESKVDGLGRCMDIGELPIPEDFMLPWLPPVENQGNIGNCVAQSIAAIYEVYEHQYFKHPAHRDFSVGYTYGLKNWNFGMFPDSACNVSVRYGNLPRSEFECLKENRACYEIIEPIRDDLIEKAKPYKYFGAKTYLCDTLSLQRFMMRYKIPAMIIISGGKHAVVCVGWKYRRWYDGYCNGKPYWREETKLYYLNSWGDWFGDNGIGTIIADDDRLTERWGLIPTDTSFNFPDVFEYHWAYDYVQDVAQKGLMKGREDRTFDGDTTVSRYEIATVFSRLGELYNLSTNDVDVTYDDVPDNHWAKEFVTEINKFGLMKGYEDNTFKGDNKINRYELAATLSRLSDKLGMSIDLQSKSFLDVPPNHWAVEHIKKVSALGLMTGRDNGRFDGDIGLTRYELAAVISRLISKIK